MATTVTSISKCNYALPIDENWKYVLANEVNTECEGKKKKHYTKSPPMKWECTIVLSQAKIGTIIDGF